MRALDSVVVAVVASGQDEQPMARELARLVVSTGESFSAPLRNLSERSVFVEGRLGLGFERRVKAVLLGHAVEARVAFVAEEPPGVVLTFDATPDLIASIRGRQDAATEGWSDEDVTGTHDGEDAMLLASMMAQATAASDIEPDVDPEEPTNTGSRALGDEEATPSAIPAKLVDGQVVEAVEDGLRGSAAPAPADESRGMRLRATTQVTPTEEVD